MGLFDGDFGFEDFFDPLLNFATGGLASGAALLPGVGQYFGNKKAQEMSLQSAREQMAFQERMSSTAHQREVEDLRKAGLNPALSAGSGGATTPGGASIEGRNLFEGVAESMSSAFSMLKTKKDIEEADSRIKVNESVKELNKANKDIKDPQAELNKTAAELIRGVKEKLGVGEGAAKPHFFRNTHTQKELREIIRAKQKERSWIKKIPGWMKSGASGQNEFVK